MSSFERQEFIEDDNPEYLLAGQNLSDQQVQKFEDIRSRAAQFGSNSVFPGDDRLIIILDQRYNPLDMEGFSLVFENKGQQHISLYCYHVSSAQLYLTLTEDNLGSQSRSYQVKENTAGLKAEGLDGILDLFIQFL